MARKSALEEVKDWLGGAFNTATSGFKSLAQDYAKYSTQQNQRKMQGAQRLQNFLGNPKNYFSPENTGGFWSSPYAHNLGATQSIVENVSKRVPKFDFTERATENIQNPVAKFGVGLGLGIPQSILNTPWNLTQGAVETGQAINQGRPATEVIGKATAPAEGILNLLTLGSLGSLGSSGSRQIAKYGAPQVGRNLTNLQRIAQGGKTGFKYGTGYGLLSGLERNQNAPDVASQLAGSIPDALIGGAVGFGAGAGTTAITIPLERTISRYIAPRVRSFFIAEQERGGVLTPNQFRKSVAGFKIKDPRFSQWADAVAKEAEQSGGHISLNIQTARQTRLGTALRVGKGNVNDTFSATIVHPQTGIDTSGAIASRTNLPAIVPEAPVVLPTAEAGAVLSQGAKPELAIAPPQAPEIQTPTTLSIENTIDDITGKAKDALSQLVPVEGASNTEGINLLRGKNYMVPEDQAVKLGKELQSVQNEIAKYDSAGVDIPKELTKQSESLSKQITGESPIDGLRQDTVKDFEKAFGETNPEVKPEENPFSDIIEGGPSVVEEPEIPFDETEEFQMALRSLNEFKKVQDEIPPIIKMEQGKKVPKIPEEELAVQVLDQFRGYGARRDTAVRYPEEVEARFGQLAEMKVNFEEQIDNISDALRNYEFYEKRFGEMMGKMELKSLRKNLRESVKSIDKEVKGLQEQGEPILVIGEAPAAPTDDELAMNALKAWRDGVPPVEKTPEEAVISKDQLPDVPAKGKKKALSNDALDEKSQKEIESALDGANDGKNTPPDFSKTQKQMFNTIFAEWIGRKDVAKTTGTEIGEQFAEIPAELGPDIIRARENPELPMTEEVASWVKPIAEEYDRLFPDAVDAGINIHYLNNYVTHIWEKAPEEVAREYMAAKTRFNFAEERIIPTYEEGIQMGLKPKFTHPAQIIAHYVERMEQAKANIKMMADLRAAGIVVPASEGVKNPGFSPISAPGVDRSTGHAQIGDKTGLIVGDYYAPRPIANILNKVFSPDERELPGKIVGATAKLSSTLQDVTLSGGLPYTPINAFSFGQAIKEVTAGVGGLWNSPVLSGKRILSPVASGLRTLVPGASKNFFKENTWAVKEMQARNIPVQTNYSIENLIDKGSVEKIFGKGAREIWRKAISDPTFKEFMPMLQVNLYKDIKTAAIKQGKAPEAAADIAAQAVKSFYGIVGSDVAAKRNKAIWDAATTVFFAPKYRESMGRMWITAAKSASPIWVGKDGVKVNNPFSLKNKTSTNFLIGTFLTVVGYNLLNIAINGRSMSENPEGTQDKLLIPMGDGNVMGIPVLPSVGTIPRAAIRSIDNILQGDLPGVLAESKSYLSTLISPLVEVASNENYFGQPIYEEDDTPDQKYAKIGKYLATQYNHPWIEAAVDKYQKGEPDYITISKGLEAPFRWYTEDSLNSRYFYNNLKEARSSLSPEAQKVWDKLYPNTGKAQFSDDNGLASDPTRSKMSNALDRLAHPEIIQAEQEAMLESARQQGTPVNPFYLLSPSQQQTVLILDTFYPGEETKKTIQNENLEWLKPYWDAKNQWIQQMQEAGIFKSKTDDEITASRKEAVYSLLDQGVTNSAEITGLLNDAAIRQGFNFGDFTQEEVNKYISDRSYIQPSPELQTKLDFYNTLPKGTGARSRYLRSNPEVLQFFEATSQLTDDKRIELGLPPVGFGGSGGGGGFSFPPAKPKLKALPKSQAINLKLTGPTTSSKSNFTPLKTTSITQGVKQLGAIRSRSFKPKGVSLAVKNSLPATISGIR